MTLQISPEQMAVYRATARRREEQRRQALAGRHTRAWAVARRGAQMLKEQFGAARVVVFGSVLYPKRFYERSDVDLAVWGLDERLYLKAVSRLLDIDPEISVDLVEAEFARPPLLAVIEQEGVAL
jgi:predicted nucleotidyltransferase